MRRWGKNVQDVIEQTMGRQGMHCAPSTLVWVALLPEERVIETNLLPEVCGGKMIFTFIIDQRNRT